MENEKNKILNKMVYSYLLIMFGIFPLVFNDAFFDMQEVKYKFFVGVTLVFIVVMGSIVLYKQIKNRSSWKMKTILKKLSLCDRVMLFLCLCTTITTCLSPVPFASFTGNQGRWLGSIFYWLICISYFLISRYFKKEQSVFLIFLFTSGLVAMLALWNSFDVDPLGFYASISDYQATMFLSTIGNIDYVGAYVCLVLPLSIVWFSFAQQTMTKIIYGVSMIFGFIFMLVANADSAYMGVGVFFIIFLFYSLKDIKQCKRYILVLIILFLTAKGVGIVSDVFVNQAHGFHTLSSIMVNSMVHDWALCILGVLYYVLYSYEKKTTAWNCKKIRYSIGALVLLVFLIVLGGILYFTFFDTSTNLGVFQNYLRINEQWGTGRGFIWNKILQAFHELPLLQKMFGYGLDTTKLALVEVLLDPTLIVWDNAHNEWLQYLLTGGIGLLLAHIGIAISIVYQGFKSSRNDPFVLGIYLLLIAYLTQAFVNINQPVTAPLFFLMVAILESFHREKKKEKEIENGREQEKTKIQ